MILCRRGKAEEAQRRMREIMGKLKLTVNEEKTRICKIPEERVRLSGLHVWADVFDAHGTGPYLATGRRRRSIQRMVRKIHVLDRRSDGMARDRSIGGTS